MSKTVTATIMFMDVVASSKFRRGRGEASAQDALRTQKELIREQVQRHSGREVKTMGDGFMLAFASARDAVNCAIAIQRTVAQHNDGRTGQLPLLRAGINIGEVREEEGDLFGLPVDAAEHIQSKAKGGQILVSELVRGVVGAAEGVQFEERGRYRLKNFPGRWRLYEVPWQAPEPSRKALTCALLICDFVGMVPLFERLGDEEGVEVLRAYSAIFRAHLDRYPVIWEKVAGDTFLAALPSPRDALECATALQKGYEARNREHSGEPLRVRMALHMGEVIQEADELYGRALNFTVVLSDAADEGQILASSQFAELAEPLEGVTFRGPRDVDLRGVAGVQRVYDVIAGG
jgi:class 3 adenylate cyclase